MRDFRKLVFWQKAHRLTLAVYSETKGFPAAELYGLTRQMRRSSASVATNIAEGSGRNSEREFARFLDIASGSASELEYQFILAHDLDFLDSPEYNRLSANVREVKQMLTSFRQKLTSDKPTKKLNR